MIAIKSVLRRFMVAGVGWLLVFSVAQATELITPSESLQPEYVVKLQLDSLMKNDFPYPDAGAAQTFAFAHPNNQRITGPLDRFSKMLRLPGYQQLLNHRSHAIKLYSQNDENAVFAVKVIDQVGNQYGFHWVVAKNTSGECTGCWLTTQVSPAIPWHKVSSPVNL